MARGGDSRCPCLNRGWTRTPDFRAAKDATLWSDVDDRRWFVKKVAANRLTQSTAKGCSQEEGARPYFLRPDHLGVRLCVATNEFEI